MNATANDCKHCVSLLLAQGADVNLKDAANQTCLHIAARCGSFTVLQLLLHAGANINARDFYQRSPLHWAVLEQRVEAAAILLRSTALDIDAADSSFLTPLSLAAQLGLCVFVRLLVVQGAFPLARDRLGRTALHHAATGIGPDTTADQHSTGPTANQLNGAASDTPLATSATTALTSARATGACADNIALLLKHCPQLLETTDNMRRTPLHLAALARNLEALRALAAFPQLRDSCDAEGCTAMHLACAGGSAACVAHLLALGLSSQARDAEGNPPFLYAALFGNLRILDILAGRAQICSLLVTLGASINAVDQSGDTTLHFTTQDLSGECCRTLIACGANVNVASTSNNQTPIFSATITRSSKCVAELLGAGCNVLGQDSRKRSLLQLAAKSHDFALCRLLVSMGSDVNHVDDSGVSVLIEAVQSDNPALVSLLLDAGAKPSLLPGGPLQPIHCAARCASVEITRVLLARGAKVNSCR
eukprot:m.154342 g.154342  ORF g.154342 m.154342 type:complete len:479 (+) comp52883_c0_seq3:286-1722(+)